MRRGAIIGSPTSSNFHSVYILTLKTGLNTRRSLMHPASSRPHHHQRAFASPPFPLQARMQYQAGVGIHGSSTPFSPVPPPSHARASRRWFHGVSTPFIPPHMPDRAGGGHSWCFRVVDTSSTSLACKSKPEVSVYGISMPFPPSKLPFPARWSRMWTFMAFWHCPRLLHLTCKTELEVVLWCALAWVRQLGHDPYNY